MEIKRFYKGFIREGVKMMINIKFRGLELMTGDWVYGSHLKTGTNLEYIVPQNLIANQFSPFAVDKDTVGQYTGLKDKNCVEIYEGDILRFKHIQENELDAEISEVCWFGDEEWYYPAFDLNGQRIKSHFEGNVLSEILSSGEFDLEIIGNIHEHPHLLEVAQ